MLNLSEIHEQIVRVSDRLEELVDEVRSAGGDAAVCEASFKSEFAKARISARVSDSYGRYNEQGARLPKMTVDEATDIATVATENLRQSHLLATNNLTVLREALRATQSRMDALRTLAASFRAAGG